jgi:hypothetical protein
MASILLVRDSMLCGSFWKKGELCLKRRRREECGCGEREKEKSATNTLACQTKKTRVPVRGHFPVQLTPKMDVISLSSSFFSLSVLGPDEVADWAKSQGQVTKRKWVRSSWDFFLDSG